MADNIREIAAKLGATVVGTIPEAQGGAFGAAKVVHDVAWLRADTQPVRIAETTFTQLQRIAEQMSTPERQVHPLDVAARLLEEAVAATAHPRG